MEPIIDPQLYDRDDLRAALAARKLGSVFNAVHTEAGLSYREIGRRTGTCESQIDAIRHGRIVEHYDVLVRIADGLGIPRGYMGLGYSGTYPERVTVADPEGAEKMLRRHLLALGGITLTGATVTKLGALLAELPGPPPVPLPSRLTQDHVRQVQDLTRRLGRLGAGDIYSAPEMTSAGAAWADRLLDVPGEDQPKHALTVALAELHIEAGCSAWDAGLYGRAMYHFARSLELATDAGDTYLQVLALRHAGLASVEHGHPDDGLKMLQCAQARTWEIPRRDQRAVVVGVSGRAAAEAVCLQESATALARLGDLDTAATALAKGRDLWTPARTDPFGDMDRPAARLELERGRLDVAEARAVTSVHRWEGGRQLSRTMSGSVLATVYVTAGDSRGLPLAHRTITDAGKLGSGRVRRLCVDPLADALDNRPGADARDLARQARQIATARA